MEDAFMTLERADDLLALRHAATDRATIVTVPERRMIALDGVGTPTGTDFARAIETLHDVAEQLRQRLHREHRIETRIGAVECAWWTHPEPPPAEVPEKFEDRRAWHWQLMIEVPHRASDDDVEAAIAAARAAAIDHAGHVRAIRFAEGRSAQILHVGGPGTEARAVGLLYREVARAGDHPRGHLHEIHVADPRYVPIERQRVILRLPIETPPA
jgi:hypothetical protein